MRSTSIAMRKGAIIFLVVLAMAVGAYALLRVFPPLGPIAGTVVPQIYVESLTDGRLPERGRLVLVDAASARLYMIENGRVQDSMRVIVGKPAAATPALSSTLHYATLNPYWNVPPELGRTLIAPRVLKDGPAYLKERGYEVVTSFGDPQVIPPEDIDWAKVAAGEAVVRVRQRPGPANSMGQYKFNLANQDGIYLHDTPKKELFAEANRALSNGCVRLEDAPRLARWLLGRDPPVDGAAAEEHVLVSREGVPVTIAYLDARAQMQLAGLQ
jgi:murein L,D-transpeptidase YcbB/YkuD